MFVFGCGLLKLGFSRVGAGCFQAISALKLKDSTSSSTSFARLSLPAMSRSSQSFEAASSKPEAGLAEWTSKIKAMQKQVDEDEESEHKRLEQEIAASRLARSRRSSRGVGYGSKTDSVDLGQFKPPADETEDTPDRHVDRVANQVAALRSLAGSKSPMGPPRDIDSKIINSPAHSDTKPPSMSLAAFIGGRATGPRLNKHTPQQDAHDPTQFEQHTRSSAPHPVFGRGGVALPGMSRQSTEKSTFPSSPGVPSISVTETPVRETPKEQPLKATEPQKTPHYSQVQHPPSETNYQHQLVRERTMSTPSGPTSKSNSTYFPTFNKAESLRRPLSPVALGKSEPSSPPTTNAYKFTPRQSLPLSSPPRNTPVTIPSLARPIRPDPKPSVIVQTPPSKNPSPAFLRAPAQKDPTPSLSRLQGRGFVQNMVKVSTQLESPSAQQSPSSPPSRRKSTVMDRWQPASASGSMSPPVSPKAIPMRKSKTFDPSMVSPKSFGETFSKTSVSAPPEPAVNSDPGLTHAIIPPQRTGGMGSATTILVYKNASVHPADEPATTEAENETDELGVRRRSMGPSSTVTAFIPPPSAAKPLSHPTKDRARKPKKTASNSNSNSKERSSYVSTPPIRVHTPAEDEQPSRITLRESPPVSPFQDEPPSPTPAARGIANRWPEQQIIGVKVVERKATPIPPPKPNSIPVGRRALPGMTANGLDRPKSALSSAKPWNNEAVSPVEPQRATVVPTVQDEHRPSTPSRHTRIPSTGNRATVMDVAQALTEQESESPIQEKPTKNYWDPEPEPGTTHLPSPPNTQADRRKSSFEKYPSVTVLPPLKEEKTPLPTPAATLSRVGGLRQALDSAELHGALEKTQFAASPVAQVPEVVHLKHTDSSLPIVNVTAILKEASNASSPPKGVSTISVEVFSIFGSTATTITTDPHIFYDTELVAVIHRNKDKTSGLVSMDFWAWVGKNKQSPLTGQENRKIEEFAARYRTSVVMVQHNQEPEELVRVLGGRMAIRQGTRAHWSAENTAMHKVISVNGVCFIDELDFAITNLCAGFAYCVSILDNVYVWYGRGSRPLEKDVALSYAQTLTKGQVTELVQGESDDDEMFWMMLGTDGFADADYWQWRATSAPDVSPRIWKIDSSGSTVVRLASTFTQSFVYVVDCIWEFFVLVGVEARGKRSEIRLALSIAEKMAALNAHDRPYQPTVHTLIFPTQIPLDLGLAFRGFLSDSDVPEHMNLLSLEESNRHLKTSLWPRTELRDPLFLPLGLHPENISSS